MTNVAVADFLAKATEKKSEKAGRSAQDAIRDIVRLAAIAESAGDIKTAIRGYELEAKHYGGFIERKADVDTDGNDVVKAIEVKFVGVDKSDD